MKLNNITSTALIGIMLMSACKKEDQHVTASLTSINISTPYDGQSIKKGDTVNIMASIAAPSEIHGYDMYIINANHDTLLVSEEHVHSSNISVNKSWVNTSNVASDVQLIIIATLDHDGNTLTQTRKFKTTL